MNERDLCNMSQPGAREARIAELVMTIAEACEVIRGLVATGHDCCGAESHRRDARDFLKRVEGK